MVRVESAYHTRLVILSCIKELAC